MTVEHLAFNLPAGTGARLEKVSNDRGISVDEIASEGVTHYLRFLEWVIEIRAESEALRRGETTSSTLEAFAAQQGFAADEVISAAKEVVWDEDLPFGIKTGEAFITYLIEGPVLDGRSDRVD